MTVFLIILGIIVGITLLLSLLIYIFLFKPNFTRYEEEFRPIDEKGFLHQYRDKVNPSAAWFLSQKLEDHYITSFDGLRLHAFLLRAEKETPKGTLLLVHGYHGIAERDFATVYDFYHELGWNVLVIDQRAHNRSEGKFLTYGIKERFDCRDWAFYINTLFSPELPIFLDGVSMGCSTVLMASGLELPGNVKGIIADCGFTSPYEIIKAVLKSWYNLPPFPIIPLSVVLVKLIAGFNMKEYSTVEALKTNRIPVLFAVGEEDDFVPPYMTDENYNACTSEKRIFKVKGASHAVSWFEDREGYEKQILEFLAEYS